MNASCPVDRGVTAPQFISMDDDTWTRDRILAWIKRHGGNKRRLAKRLGISERTLYAALDDPEGPWYRPLPASAIAHMQTIDLHES